MGTPQANPVGLFEFAAEADLTFELDRFCRLRAFENGRDLPSESKLFVNVFPSAMYDPDFQGAALIKLLGGLGLSPDRIVLEVTEQYAIDNYTVFMEAMQNFTQMGFQIAVDDVGAGYSSLEKVARLKPKYLKFDMRLVRGIDGSHIQREMARALKTVAAKMDAMVIAEGIEREGELAAVRDLGIEYGQGYLLGRPADLASIKASLATGGPPAAAGAPGPTPTTSSKTAAPLRTTTPPTPPPIGAAGKMSYEGSMPWEPPVEPPDAAHSLPGLSFSFPDETPAAPATPLPVSPEGGQPMLPPGFEED
jgi:EAL domain-containing protein (putative c-di-GMP-specific phosphodiesterase class I)